MGQGNILEDIDLWRRLINDDRQALSVLFRKYYKPLLNYGLQLVPKIEVVKDSIQELFFTIWNKRDKLSDIEYVSAYLYSSMRRSLFRQVKKQRTWQERDQTYFEEVLDVSELNVEQSLILEEIQNEKRKNLQVAFESLNGHQKEAAFFKFYSGLSNDEISEIMDVKKNSVYNYIYRAVSTLRENMDISLTG